MKSRLRGNWRLFLLILMAAPATYLEHRWRVECAGDALEVAVVRISNGTSAVAVERQLGSPPDEVIQEKGVLVDGVTFLLARNTQAGRYGEPQPYEIRVWRRGSVTGTVVFDLQGRAVGRNVMRPYRPRSFWDQIERWIGRLLTPLGATI
jgi:hypothetical protein